MNKPVIWVPCPECGKPKRRASIRCKACFKRLSLRRLSCHCYSRNSAVHCQMIRYRTSRAQVITKYGECKCKCHKEEKRPQVQTGFRRRRVKETAQ